LPFLAWLRRRLWTIMSSAEHIYSIADNHAQTVQVCIDRLHELGAKEQLKVLTGRLRKLAIRSQPGDDDKGT
jgi:head-tail adaptor